MELAIALTAAWLVSGVWFWIAAMIWGGWPDCWHSDNSRRQGWDEALFIYLPICAVGGLVFWAIRAVYAIRGA